MLIIPEPNIVIGKVIKGVIVGVDNAPGGRVVPPDSPDHHGLNGGRLQHGQLVLLAQGLEAGQPLGELDDELDGGEGGLGHLDQGLVLDIRLVVDEAVNLVQQGHAGVLQLSLGLDQVVDQFSLMRGGRTSSGGRYSRDFLARFVSSSSSSIFRFFSSFSATFSGGSTHSDFIPRW